MASGWNQWVWLVSVVKEVYRYPHNNYYFSLLHLYYIALFLAASSLFLCSFFECFFILVYVIFVQML